MIVTMAYDEDLANRIREPIASGGVSGEGGLMFHCSKEERGSPRQARCATV